MSLFHQISLFRVQLFVAMTLGCNKISFGINFYYLLFIIQVFWFFDIRHICQVILQMNILIIYYTFKFSLLWHRLQQAFARLIQFIIILNLLVLLHSSLLWGILQNYRNNVKLIKYRYQLENEIINSAISKHYNLSKAASVVNREYWIGESNR